MRFIFAFLSVILCAITVCAGDIRIADSLKPTDLRVIGQETGMGAVYFPEKIDQFRSHPV